MTDEPNEPTTSGLPEMTKEQRDKVNEWVRSNSTSVLIRGDSKPDFAIEGNDGVHPKLPVNFPS